MAMSRKHIRRTFAAGAAVVVLGALLFALRPASASETAPLGIRNFAWDGTGCLDVDRNHVHDFGALVQLFGCHGDDNQVWTVQGRAASVGGGFKLVNRAGGLCLSAQYDSVGPHVAHAAVWMWECREVDEQVWEIRHTVDPNRVVFVNRYATQVLRDAGINRTFVLDADPDADTTSGGIFGLFPKYLVRTQLRLTPYDNSTVQLPGRAVWTVPFPIG